MFTLYTGLAGALFHWALALHAIRVGGVTSDWYPVLFSYGLILMFTAIARDAGGARGEGARAAKPRTKRQPTSRPSNASPSWSTIFPSRRDIQSGLLPPGARRTPVSTSRA